MRLITLSEAERDKSRPRFKTRGWPDASWCLVFLVLTFTSIGTFFWQYHFESISLWWGLLAFWFVFWFGLLAKITWSRFRASRLPTNWLAQFGDDLLLVKFRSYLNHQHPVSDTVIFAFTWKEIASARRLNETSTKPGDEGNTIEKFTYLELTLALHEPHLEYIESTLKNEQSTLFELTKQKGPSHQRSKLLISSRGRTKDYPVRFIEPNLLRIRWNGITPGVTTALDECQQRIAVGNSEDTFIDTSQDTLSSDELLALVQERMARGEDFDAIALLKKHKNLSTTDAVHFLETIRRD